MKYSDPINVNTGQKFWKVPIVKMSSKYFLTLETLNQEL